MGTANVLRTKTEFSVVIVISGKLGAVGADCILQQQGAEIKVSGDAVFFAQQESPPALCRAVIIGQAEL